MDVSLRTQYALRALVCLAVRSGEGALSSAEIAAFGRVSRKYTEQVMQDLRQAGFVAGRRGKGGGYVMARSPTAITVLEVVEAVEGSLDRLGRMDGADPLGPVLEPLWGDVRQTLGAQFGATTVADLAERIAPEMYHI
jgi:Rrf2 family protein